jgi:hypothetical protein
MDSQQHLHEMEEELSIKSARLSEYEQIIERNELLEEELSKSIRDNENMKKLINQQEYELDELTKKSNTLSELNNKIERNIRSELDDVSYYI